MFDTLSISSSAMKAQSQRLNVIASNIANADTVTSSDGSSYKSRHVVFQTQYDGSVKATHIVQSNSPAKTIYDPKHPLADSNGYVYQSNVNISDEMVDMIGASRSYQTQVDVFNQMKKLLEQTIKIGEM